MAILLQGVVLLVSGVSIVFIFLSLLVWVMNRATGIVSRFNYILPDDAPKKKNRPAVRPASDDDAAVAVAIAAAVSRAA